MNTTMKNALSAYAANIHMQLDVAIQRKIALCNSSLYNGPVYLTANGDETSCFDDDCTDEQDFSADCNAISEAINEHVTDIYMNEDGEISKQNEWEDFSSVYLVEAKEIIQRIVGKELSQYV